LLGALSLLIGVFWGFLSALFFKHVRSLTHNAINQAVVLLCFAYLSYLSSEMLHESGIISLLVCGIVQAHYTYYNLSSLGQHASYVVFQFLSFFMEAFVFIYLGVSFFSFGHLKWCPKLIIVEIFVIMVGRFIAVVGLLLFLKICKYDSKLTFKQQIFVWFAGMIRGAIAFGLVLKIDGKKFAARDVIVTTSLVLVIFTTVFYGAILGVL
jgi:NhaP-type Na+/H+ or K+/H+ antiporter